MFVSAIYVRIKKGAGQILQDFLFFFAVCIQQIRFSPVDAHYYHIRSMDNVDSTRSLPNLDGTSLTFSLSLYIQLIVFNNMMIVTIVIIL